MKKMINFYRSIINAFHGLIYIFKSQRNFRLQSLAGLFVLIIGLVFAV